MSIKVTTIRGIPIYLHVTLLLLLFFLMARWGALGLPAGVLLFGSVLLHELGHSVVAQRFGIPIAGINLHLLGGAAMMTRSPDRPSQELAIAAAGPLVSVVLGGLFTILSFIAGVGLNSFAHPSAATLLPYAAMVNLGMGLFNLIPAFPMDGGRILRAVLSRRLGDLRATQVAARAARGLAWVFGLVGLASGIWSLPLIGIFVYFLAGQEERMAAARRVQRIALEQQQISWPSSGYVVVVDVPRR